MKLILSLVLIAFTSGLLLGAETKKKETGKASEAAQPLKLPKDAVQVEQYTWRYKDPQGKTWIYRQTPFGLVRYEENKDEASRSSKDKEAVIQATEDGDSIRFERPGPFGNWRWTKKKVEELTSEELEAWERFQKASKTKE